MDPVWRLGRPRPELLCDPVDMDGAGHIDRQLPSLPSAAVLKAAVPRRTQLLAQRLKAARVPPDADPMIAWRRLREVEGARATVIDLYALAAAPRGLNPWELDPAERQTLGRAATEQVWPGFELAAGSERYGDVLEIVDHDPRWDVRYEQWRGRLQNALGAAAVRIEHMGSTAVAGLAAKPIVDVLVGVRALDNEAAYVPQIEGLGLQLRSRDLLHRYFRPFAGRPRDVHIHVCAAGSAWEREHLVFRDRLRTDPGMRDEYAKVKRAAAALWHDDRVAYTEAKSEFILDVIAPR